MERNACVHILMKQGQDTKISCFSLVGDKNAVVRHIIV